MLDVGEIGGVTTAMIGMAIGPARTPISGALTLGHADALHIEIRDVLRSGFGLIRSDCQAGKRHGY
jgi:hypothetical protein